MTLTRIPPSPPFFLFCSQSVHGITLFVHLWRPLRFEERNRIFRPCALNVCLCLLLPFAHPRYVVLLSDSHTGVAENNRDPLKRYPSQQEFDGERVTETMRVALCKLRSFNVWRESESRPLRYSFRVYGPGRSFPERSEDIVYTLGPKGLSKEGLRVFSSRST
jgi:hypothetical protein